MQYHSAYHKGCRARNKDKPYNANPYDLAHNAVSFYWWCAGWNDTDRRIDVN